MISTDISRVDPRPDLHVRLVDDAWVPADQEEVDWLLRRAARLSQDVAEVTHQVQREIRALQYGLELETKADAAEAARCRAKVEAWVREQDLPAGRVVVTTRSSYGKVTRRRLEPKVTVTDEAAVIRAIGLDHVAVHVPAPELSWATLKPLVTIHEDGVYDPTTGEQLPGLTVEVRPDDVKVEPIESNPPEQG